MSKICGTCGSVLPDDATICSSCGAYQESDGSYGRKKSKKTVGIIIAAVAAVAAVIVLVFGIVAIVNNTGYKGVVKNYVTALEDSDKIEKKLVPDLSSFIVELLEKGTSFLGIECDDGDIADLIETYLKLHTNNIKDKTGHAYKLSYTINDYEDMDEDDLDDIMSGLGLIGVDTDSVTNFRDLDITITAKGKKGKYVFDLDLYLTEEDGEWKILMADFDW